MLRHRDRDDQGAYEVMSLPPVTTKAPYVVVASLAQTG
jgi:hypothetical protein